MNNSDIISIVIPSIHTPLMSIERFDMFIYFYFLFSSLCVDGAVSIFYYISQYPHSFSCVLFAFQCHVLLQLDLLSLNSFNPLLLVISMAGSVWVPFAFLTPRNRTKRSLVSYSYPIRAHNGFIFINIKSTPIELTLGARVLS